MNENLEKDYDSLLLEYNDLVDKFNDLQEELYNIKSNQTRDDYTLRSFRRLPIPLNPPRLAASRSSIPTARWMTTTGPFSLPVRAVRLC